MATNDIKFNAEKLLKFGAAETNPDNLGGNGALNSLNNVSPAAIDAFGLNNFKQAVEVANLLKPKQDPFDPNLAMFLFFTKMGEAASKPGATALGAASIGAQEPLKYLMAKQKEERAAQAAVGPTALRLSMMSTKNKNAERKLYEEIDTGKTTWFTTEEFNKQPNQSNFRPYKAPGAGTDKERYVNQLIKIGPKLLANAKVPATPAERSRYSIAYQQLSKGYTTVQMVNGKEQTIRVAGIDLTKQPNLPIPEGFDAAKLLSQKSREFGSLGTNANFAQRMLFQEGIVRKVLDDGYKLNAKDVTADGMPDFIGTTLQSDEGQRFYAASRNFIAAVLRKESGAAISDGEYLNGLKQYFPQVGNTAEVISDKEALRSAAITGMYRESGDAFASMYPEAVKFMKTTVGDKTFDIINPRSYSEFQLAKVQKGKSIFADAVIESLDLDGLSGLIAKPDFSTRYTEKQQKRIAERARELRGVKK
tara:strand:+ start:6977 stop:8407 length:1431 start_codon:yes stop_codon:yes gene_type:complete